MCKHLHAEGDHGAGGPIVLKIAKSFERHFNYLKNLPDTKVQFDVIFDYNQRLHSCFVLDFHTFCMNDFHSYVWQECLNQQYAARVAHLNNKLAIIESFLPKSKSKDTSNNTFFLLQHNSVTSHRLTKYITCGATNHKLIACH